LFINPFCSPKLKHVPAKYLPEDMGGSVSNKNQADWTAKLKKLAPKVY
jgi:hypothetical protein